MKTLKAITAEIAARTGFDMGACRDLAKQAHSRMAAARKAAGCIVHEPTRIACEAIGKTGSCRTQDPDAIEFLRCLGCWQKAEEMDTLRA